MEWRTPRSGAWHRAAPVLEDRAGGQGEGLGGEPKVPLAPQLGRKAGGALRPRLGRGRRGSTRSWTCQAGTAAWRTKPARRGKKGKEARGIHRSGRAEAASASAAVPTAQPPRSTASTTKRISGSSARPSDAAAGWYVLNGILRHADLLRAQPQSQRLRGRRPVQDDPATAARMRALLGPAPNNQLHRARQ